MQQEPGPKKPEPLTAAIIADMKPGEERGDAQCPGVRVRRSATGKAVFFFRYPSKDGALRAIRPGGMGPSTLAKARDAAHERIARRQSAYTVNDLVDEYGKEVLSKQERGVEAERLLRKDFLPVFDGKPATELTRRRFQDELIRAEMLCGS